MIFSAGGCVARAVLLYDMLMHADAYGVSYVHRMYAVLHASSVLLCLIRKHEKNGLCTSEHCGHASDHMQQAENRFVLSSHQNVDARSPPIVWRVAKSIAPHHQHD